MAAARQYPEYALGDRIVRNYGAAEESSGKCELTHRPDGIVTIARTSDSGYWIGVWPPSGVPGRWRRNEDGIGIPDGDSDEVAKWITDELIAFRKDMEQLGALQVVPAKGRAAA